MKIKKLKHFYEGDNVPIGTVLENLENNPPRFFNDPWVVFFGASEGKLLDRIREFESKGFIEIINE